MSPSPSLPSVAVLGLGFYTQSGHAVSGADFSAGEKLFFRADLARLWLHIECRTLFCEKRDFGRLRSCSYSRKTKQSEGPVGTQQRQNMKKRERMKVEKL